MGFNVNKSTKNAKYLSVEISKKLSWKTHIDSITSKANKSSAFINRNLKGCSTQIQAHCYKTITRPVLEYASTIWDPHQKSLTDQIDVSYETSVKPPAHLIWWKGFKLQNLKQRRENDKITMLYKIVNGKVDITAPPGLLVPAYRSTRGHQKKFQIPRFYTDVYKFSFFPLAIRCWNNLSPETVDILSLPAFKRAVEGATCSQHWSPASPLYISVNKFFTKS